MSSFLVTLRLSALPRRSSRLSSRLRSFGALAMMAVMTVTASAGSGRLDGLAGRYTVGAGSTVTFSISGTLAPTVHGQFGQFSGLFRLDPVHAERSSVSFTVAAGSVTTGIPPLDSLLRSSIIFDATDHPDIRFVSTAVHRTSETTAEVDGMLTLKGQTQPEHFSVALADNGGGKASFHVIGHVARSAFDMNVGRPVYADEVVFDLNVEGQRLGAGT
jgi:polyisoprenoid-binding protein YceI